MRCSFCGLWTENCAGCDHCERDPRKPRQIEQRTCGQCGWSGLTNLGVCPQDGIIWGSETVIAPKTLVAA